MLSAINSERRSAPVNPSSRRARSRLPSREAGKAPTISFRSATRSQRELASQRKRKRHIAGQR